MSLRRFRSASLWVMRISGGLPYGVDPLGVVSISPISVRTWPDCRV